MNSGAEHSFARSIADLVLSDLRTELDALYDALQEQRSAVAPGADVELISGLDPNGLYAVSYVAERWSVSADFVRDLDAEALPRAAWPGSEIRYRGADILRAEGVDVIAAPIHRMGNPSQKPRANGKKHNPVKKRAYSKNLPPLPGS